MFLNIETCENGWWNFSENLRNVTLKLLVNSIFITKSINLQSSTLILYGAGVRFDQRRFSVLSTPQEQPDMLNTRVTGLIIIIFMHVCPLTSAHHWSSVTKSITSKSVYDDHINLLESLNRSLSHWTIARLNVRDSTVLVKSKSVHTCLIHMSTIPSVCCLIIKGRVHVQSSKNQFVFVFI